MSLLKNLFGGSYEDLWKAVIRPNRDEYKEEDLGPEKFKINHKYYKRTDFSITNKRGLKLMCSFWEPFDEERDYVRLPCVVYLHGNSSSRCEAVAEVKYLLPLNITVFAFDFSGCGKSQGEYISLGYYEREDVESVIEYLRKTNKVSTIGLWGRSMGAVTAIMYGDRDPSIAGMVLDSAFASLKELIEELVKDFVPQLKPIEVHLVPSKLRLNKKGFKDLKCNKDNKILLMSNNYFISCPNSEEEEEEESEIDFSPQKNNKNEDIKSTRKNLHKMK